MNEWINGWINGWMNGLMDEWMEFDRLLPNITVTVAKETAKNVNC